jgi:hypothetical protein
MHMCASECGDSEHYRSVIIVGSKEPAPIIITLATISIVYSIRFPQPRNTWEAAKSF